MTFQPKHLPYQEALRVVADRAKIAKDQVNPLHLALAEEALRVEVRGEDGKWNNAEKMPAIWFRNPYIGNHQEPGSGQVAATDVRLAVADIDKLWPANGMTSIVQPEYISPFLQLMLEATAHFKIAPTSQPMKADLVSWFKKAKLPDGTSPSDRLADAMATLCRSQEARAGGNVSQEKAKTINRG